MTLSMLSPWFESLSAILLRSKECQTRRFSLCRVLDFMY